MIKLLKAYYTATDDLQRRVDIPTRLVLRMLDEDDGVKDLAAKSLEELWFSDSTPDSKTEGISSGHKAFIFMRVCVSFWDRQAPLEDMLRKIVTGKNDTQAAFVRAQYTHICHVLLDALVDDADIADFVSVFIGATGASSLKIEL